MKAAVLSCFIAIIFMIQVVMADVFSQLQFMKIISPTNGQSIQAGDKVTVKYVMQPKIFSKYFFFNKYYISQSNLASEGTSNGFATRLDINFHKRSGNTKQNQIQHVAQKWLVGY
jgi:hypothetical protein